MNGKCPYCNKNYEYYCHEACPETGRIIEKLQNIQDLGKDFLDTLTYDELDFIIDALIIRYEGGD